MTMQLHQQIVALQLLLWAQLLLFTTATPVLCVETVTIIIITVTLGVGNNPSYIYEILRIKMVTAKYIYRFITRDIMLLEIRGR
jgi:hypothetical protein